MDGGPGGGGEESGGGSDDDEEEEEEEGKGSGVKGGGVHVARPYEGTLLEAGGRGTIFGVRLSGAGAQACRRRMELQPRVLEGSRLDPM